MLLLMPEAEQSACRIAVAANASQRQNILLAMLVLLQMPLAILVLPECHSDAEQSACNTGVAAYASKQLQWLAGTCRLDPAEVEKKGDRLVWSHHPDAMVTAQKHKMSKSRGNVVNPTDVVYRYGADSLRLYEMFLGPLQDTKVCSCLLPALSRICMLHRLSRHFSWLL